MSRTRELLYEPDGSWGPERDGDLAIILDLIRSGSARTRPELTRVAGLGRSAVNRQLDLLTDLGLVTDGALVPSTGGRAPRSISFKADAGTVLVAELGATSASVGVSNLAGKLMDQQEEPLEIAEGPERVIAELTKLFDGLIDRNHIERESLWGVGLGVPGPVEFSTGRAISPPIMPGWNAYPIRSRLAELCGLPVWVDNDVNLLALGELRSGIAQGEKDAVYLKIGTGIGAGIICDGRLHRGAQGCAGDIGHVAVPSDTDVICRCGNHGCLEALAGGFALARDGTAAGESDLGLSPYLASVLSGGRTVTAEDIIEGAQRGDSVCTELLQRSGRLVGEALASIVSFYNPSLIIVGGRVAGAGDVLLAAIRETVYRRSLPLATRDLRIAFSSLGDEAGLRGAAAMVTDELFASSCLRRWLPKGSPAGMPNLVSA
jgi:glucokinase-like ROK family protein